jgi:P27 family predicted phage terminase small subunit
VGGITHRKPPGTALGHRRHTVTVLPPPAQQPPPACPPGLLKATRDRWDAFWDSSVAAVVDHDADLPRLHRWIRATDEYDRVAKVCRQARIVRGSMGQPVLNPLFAYLAQLEQQIRSAETEFGMTPMSRIRLGIALNAARRGAGDGSSPAAPASDPDRRRRLLSGGTG